MGSALPTAMVWSVLVYSALTAVTAVAKLAREADVYADAWDGERRVRECGWVAAANRNIAAAGAALADLDPEGDTAYIQAAEATAGMLREAYPSARLADPNGECSMEEFTLGTRLHLQRHPEQAEEWPNWVPRFWWSRR